MKEMLVMHYLNQFFAGKGGEDKADVPVGFHNGPLGPGRRLQALLGDLAKNVVTVYCGDNYFSGHTSEALAQIMQIVSDKKVRIVVAGPAFDAGRYGFACMEVCHFLSISADLKCVTGMHIENPGLLGYRQYKDRNVFAFPTSQSISGLEDALSRMARCILKLAAGDAMGPASEEGYIPRGFRVDEVVSKSGVERATEMLLNKLAGRVFSTELPVESIEAMTIPPPIANLTDACLALATTCGLVPLGNPDGLRAHRNTQWRKYSIDKLNSMKDGKWDVSHGGYDTVFMHDNPNYGVPLDVCRELERQGVFARLYPSFYATVGCGGGTSAMQTVAREMAVSMKDQGVNGILLVST